MDPVLPAQLISPNSDRPLATLGLGDAATPAAVGGDELALLDVETTLAQHLPFVEAAAAEAAVFELLRRTRSFEGDDVSHTALALGMTAPDTTRLLAPQSRHSNAAARARGDATGGRALAARRARSRRHRPQPRRRVSRCGRNSPRPCRPWPARRPPPALGQPTKKQRRKPQNKTNQKRAQTRRCAR